MDKKIEMSLMATALDVCTKYYDGKTMLHASRVACYVMTNPLIDEDCKELCAIVALLHDLVEDTDYTFDQLRQDFSRLQVKIVGRDPGNFIADTVSLLTKQKDESYDEYIFRLKDAVLFPEGTVAYWVKIADMKDHLSLKDTLTEKRKAKYLSGLAILL